jgi:hypothetical protein
MPRGRPGKRCKRATDPPRVKKPSEAVWGTLGYSAPCFRRWIDDSTHYQRVWYSAASPSLHAPQHDRFGRGAQEELQPAAAISAAWATRQPKSSLNFHSAPRVTRPASSIFSTERVASKSLEQVERDVKAGMSWVVHVIGASDIVDINVIVVAPACRPLLRISEQIAAIPEAIKPVDKPGAAHAKGVATTKIGAEMVVGNATIMVAIVPYAMEVVVPMVVSEGTSLPVSALLRLLCFLFTSTSHPIRAGDLDSICKFYIPG